MPEGSTRTVSHYRLIEKIGQGGMGAVWKAEDTLLRRTVALKFLTETSFGKEQLAARFLREARTAATLSHSNICVVYEIGSISPGEEEILGPGARMEAGMPFIAMEMIEGQTLAARLQRDGPLPLDELLRVALGIAEGLAAAHAKGIVHRDLKPGNVMLTPEGGVKILDFGLAKPHLGFSDETLTAAETISGELTRQGQILGTVAYMSPEQARGEPVDTRSDVFSFGIVLHEMATGKRPFRGESPASVLARLLESEPESIEECRDDLPEELLRIVRRCLKKEADERHNDTRDLVAALADLRSETGATRVRSKRLEKDRRRGRMRAAGLAGALVVVAAAATAAWYLTREPTPAPTTRPVSHRQVTFTGEARSPAISPDGQYVAFVTATEAGGAALMLQDVAGGQPLELLEARMLGVPTWSPDGTRLLVPGYTEESDDGKVRWYAYLLPRLGGDPRVFEFTANEPSWSPDGKRFVTSALAAKRLSLVDVATGERDFLPLEGEFTFLYDHSWSPLGDRILFKTVDSKQRVVLWTITTDGSGQTSVLESDAMINSPVWASAGDAFYYLLENEQTKDLMKLRVDPASGRRQGEPRTVLSGLNSGGAISLSADDRRMAYTRFLIDADLWLVMIPEPGSSGEMQTRPLTSGSFRDTHPSLSPDGRRVVFARSTGGVSNLHVMPVQGGTAEQLTFGESRDFCPAWSPDGTKVAFVSTVRGDPHVHVVDAEGGTPRPFLRTEVSIDSACPISWEYGDSILYQRPGNRNWHRLDPATETETPLLEDDARKWMFGPRVSPDGSRVAVRWVRDRTIGLWTLSSGGRNPVKVSEVHTAHPLGWSGDGARIFAINYASTPPLIFSMPAAGGSETVLAKLPFEAIGRNGTAAPDGRSFVLSVETSQSDVWIAENFDPKVR
jgi:Tol biopolymer transport system component